MVVLFAGLAAAVGFAVVGLELVTGKYPRSWPFVRQSRSFWLYCLIYGALAAVGFWGLDALVAAKKIQMDDGVLASQWLRAVVVGVSVKSLLHINLFNVTVNSQPFPIGVETFTQLFEPTLLRNILFDEFNAVRKYVTPLATRYPDLQAGRQKILQNIPSTLPQQEVGAFKDELSKAVDVVEALEKGFRFLGQLSFHRIFP